MSQRDPALHHYEDLTDKELRSRMREVQYKLIQALRQEATRLGNKDDVESLGEALQDSADIDFDLSRYWGYDTRPDAPAQLKSLVKEFEQLQGVYFERQGAAAVAQELRQQRRRNAILLLGIAAIIGIVAAWVRFVPNRFSIDLREQRLKKLEFMPSFSAIAGQPMQDVARSLHPTPPAFAAVTKSYAALMAQPLTSMYGGLLGVWQVRDSAGQLTRLLLTGTPDRLTQRRLHKALLTLLLRPDAPEAAAKTWVTTGLWVLPGELGKALLPTLRRLQRDTTMLRFYTLPQGLDAQVQQAIQRRSRRKPLRFRSLLTQHKLSAAVALVPLPHGHTGKPLSFSISLPQPDAGKDAAPPGTDDAKGPDNAAKGLALPKTGALRALIEAEIAPWFAPPVDAKAAPKPPKATLPKALRTAFTGLVTPALWDATLRGLPLPLVRFQQSYQAWRHEHRRALWLALYQAMLKAKVPPDALQGPRVFFRVHQTKTALLVRPMWLLDLAHDALSQPTKPYRVTTQKAPDTTWHPPKKDSAATRSRQPVAPGAAPPNPALLGSLAVRFAKLYSPKGRQNLMSIGQLYPTFERLWRANVPVHEQFKQPASKKQQGPFRTFAQFGRLIHDAEKTLRTVAHQRRAASYVLEMNDPKVGPLFAWMRRSPIKTDAQLYLTAQIRGRMGIISYHTPIRNGAWRIRMAHVLLRSSQTLLDGLAKKLFAAPIDAPLPPPMRLLRARLRHEQGRYTDALKELLQATPGAPVKSREMLAFYHPSLEFKVLTKGATGRLLPSWSALFDHNQTHTNGTPSTPQLILQGATQDAPSKVQKLLALKELPAQVTQHLLGLLNRKGAPWRSAPTLPIATKETPSPATQLLLRQLPVRKEIKVLYDALNTRKHQHFMAVELAFGCRPPSAMTIPMSRPCKHPFFRPPAVIQFLPPLSVKGKRK